MLQTILIQSVRVCFGWEKTFWKLRLFHLYVYQGIFIPLLWGCYLCESVLNMRWGVVRSNGVNIIHRNYPVLPYYIIWHILIVQVNTWNITTPLRYLFFKRIFIYPRFCCHWPQQGMKAEEKNILLWCLTRRPVCTIK